MKFFDLVSSAVANTFRSKTRTILTVLALFIGAFTLTLTTAVGAGVTSYVTKQVSSLGASDMLLVSAGGDTNLGDGPKKYDPEKSSATSGMPGGANTSSLLTEKDLNNLREINNVGDVSPIRTVSIDFVQVGSGQKYQLSLSPTSSIGKADLVAGSQLSNSTDEYQLMLPSDYLEPLGFRVAEEAVGKQATLGLTDILGEKHELKVTIVGVAQKSLLSTGAGSNEALSSAASDLQQAGIEAVKSKYSYATAKIEGSLTKESIDAIKADIKKADMTAQTLEDQLGVVTTIIAGIVGVLNAFAVVALIAAAFGIVNTLLMSVQERTREIGLMKAMGMSGRKVFGLFSLEAIFIGFLGSGIGALAAVIVGTGISKVLGSGPLSGLPGLEILIFEPTSIVGIMLLIMGIAFLSGTLPARRAAKQNPIDALRYE